MKIRPTAEKRDERRHLTTPYQRTKGFVDTVKDWLTPSKWVTWRGASPGVERGSHVISQGSSSGGSASSRPLAVTASSREREGRRAVEGRSNEWTSPLFHGGLLAGRNGLIAGNSGPIPGSGTVQRLSQQMEVTGASPPVGASVAAGDHTGPITSTPQVSPEIVVQEHDGNEIRTTASRQRERSTFSMSTFRTPSYRHTKTELSLSQSPFKSPFYSGQTSFGGASSVRRKRERAESSPPLGVNVSRVRVQAQPMVSTVAGSSASQTARRILSTLQSMSSPLTDARRLPLRTTPTAKRARRGSSPSMTTPPPVSSLTAPSPAPLSSAHQPVVVFNEQQPSPGTRTVSFTLPGDQAMPTQSEQGRRSMAAVTDGISPMHTSPKPGTLSPDQAFGAGKSRGSSGGGKIRSSRHSTHYSSRRDSSSDSTPVNPLSLPPPISLMLSPTQPLPVLSFTAALPSPTVHSPPAFSFAKPKPVVRPQTVSLGDGESHSQTVRSSSAPVLGLPKIGVSVGRSSSDTVTVLSTRGARMTSPGERFPPPGKPPASSEPPTPPLKTVSVLEALRRPEYQIENIRKEAQRSSRRGPVEVVDLTDDDSPEKSKEVPQASAGVEKDKPALIGKPLLLPGKPAGTWDCDECWTSNKQEAVKCAACGSAREAPASAASLAGGSSSAPSQDKPLPGPGMGSGLGTGLMGSMGTGLMSKTAVAAVTSAPALGGGGLKAGLGSAGSSLTSLASGSAGKGSSISGGVPVAKGKLITEGWPVLVGKGEGGGMKLAGNLPSLVGAASSSSSMFSSSASSLWSTGAGITLGSSGLKLGGASLPTRVADKDSTATSSSTAGISSGTSSLGFKLSSDTMPTNMADDDNSTAPSKSEPVSERSSTKPSVQVSLLKTTAVGSWDCPCCMLINKPSATLCPACGAPMPGPAPNPSHKTPSFASESAKSTLGAGLGPGGQPSLGSGLEKPLAVTSKPGMGPSPGQTGLSLGQSGLSLGQSGLSLGQSGSSLGQPGSSLGQPGSSLGQPGLSLGQSGPVLGQSGLSLGQSGLSIGQSGPVLGQSGLSLGQSGLSIGQSSLGQSGMGPGLAGGKLPQLAGKPPAPGQPTSSTMQQPPPLTPTGTASHIQPSLIAGSSNGGLPATSGGGGAGMVMPPLRKLHSSSASQVTASGLPSLGTMTTAPFTFGAAKSTVAGGSSLQGLTFVPPTFPSTTSVAATTTTATVPMATAPGAATFNFSGASGPKLSVPLEPGGLFKPPQTGLGATGTQPPGPPLPGNNPLGAAGGLAFGSNTSAAAPSLSPGGPKLLFGGTTPRNSGVGGSSLQQQQQQQQQQSLFSLQTGPLPSSQNKPNFSLSSGSSLLFGNNGNSTGFASQQQSQFGAGGLQVTMPMGRVTMPMGQVTMPMAPVAQTTTTTNTTTAGFNFAQFVSATAPQLQFVQPGTLSATANNSASPFQFGSSNSASTSSMASAPFTFTGQRQPPIGGRTIKRAVRRRK